MSRSPNIRRGSHFDFDISRLMGPTGSRRRTIRVVRCHHPRKDIAL